MAWRLQASIPDAVRFDELIFAPEIASATLDRLLHESAAFVAHLRQPGLVLPAGKLRILPGCSTLNSITCLKILHQKALIPG